VHSNDNVTGGEDGHGGEDDHTRTIPIPAPNEKKDTLRPTERNGAASWMKWKPTLVYTEKA